MKPRAHAQPLRGRRGGRAGGAGRAGRSRSSACRTGATCRGLPLGWVIAASALWCGGVRASLTAALVPRRGDVLPAPGRASRVAAAAMLARGGCSRCSRPSTFRASACTRPNAAGRCSIPACIASARRQGGGGVPGRRPARAAPPGPGRRLARRHGAGRRRRRDGRSAAVFICPFATTAHVVLGHVGGMVLAAVAGALLAAAVIRR